jgi:malonyl-CoA/methylmalonyl-CoA synthetase
VTGPAPTPAPHWRVHLPAGVAPRDVDLAAGGSLPGAFARAWLADPGRAALLSPDGSVLRAGELEERTAAAAARYAAAGLAPGDRVLMSAQPSVELVVAYVGALRLGLAVVPANTAYTGPELAHVVADAAPALAVVDEPGRMAGLSESLLVAGTDLTGLPAPAGDPLLDAAAPDDVALVVYTSGTTGAPKGAPLTHANLLASAHAVRIAWRWTADDRLALCLPLFHVHGLGVGLHGTLVTGAAAIVAARFDPALVAGLVADRGATMFFGVPTMYHRLAGSPYLAGLRPLRLAVSGSAPLPAQLHRAVAEGSGQRVLERYGMSETIMLVSNPYDGERRPGTVGFPLPGVSVRLAPRDGGVSEIEVTGPNVISGYLNRPDANAEAFTADGWFRTGDLGVLDDGYLRISGRAKELIISGGYNVYPREVEEVLRAHPAVVDAAVVGAASAEWGETVVAFVVAGAGGSAALEHELAEWCEGRLAPYKRPRVWRWADSIPRNAMGKILRHTLVP